MGRVTINKKVLDRLIRAKVEGARECLDVQPMPVVWVPRNGQGCNWKVPGWTGANGNVQDCIQKMESYLQFLKAQFDVPEGDQ